MTQLTLQKATLKDFQEAACNLSRSDLTEFHCVRAGRDPRDVLPGYLDETSCVIKVGALVVAVGGSKDCLWFVTTTVVDLLTKRQRLQFLRLLKEHLSNLPNYLGDKTNFVSVDNKPHIRLLKHLGASFSDSITMSQAGFAFRQFWL